MRNAKALQSLRRAPRRRGRKNIRRNIFIIEKENMLQERSKAYEQRLHTIKMHYGQNLQSETNTKGRQSNIWLATTHKQGYDGHGEVGF